MCVILCVRALPEGSLSSILIIFLSLEEWRDLLYLFFMAVNGCRLLSSSLMAISNRGSCMCVCAYFSYASVADASFNRCSIQQQMR